MSENVYRLLRLANNKSVRELAQEMGVSASYISEVEIGKRTPSNDMREKYSRALKVRQSTILYFEEEGETHNLNFQQMLLMILQKICSHSEAE